MIANIKEPQHVEPGKPAKEAYHYKRNGSTNIFMFAELLSGRRTVELFEIKTGLDYVEALRILVEDLYRMKIIFVDS